MATIELYVLTEFDNDPDFTNFIGISREQCYLQVFNARKGAIADYLWDTGEIDIDAPDMDYDQFAEVFSENMSNEEKIQVVEDFQEYLEDDGPWYRMSTHILDLGDEYVDGCWGFMWIKVWAEINGSEIASHNMGWIETDSGDEFFMSTYEELKSELLEDVHKELEQKDTRVTQLETAYTEALLALNEYLKAKEEENAGQ